MGHPNVDRQVTHSYWQNSSPPPPAKDTNDQFDDWDLDSPPGPILDDSFEDKTGLAPPPVLMLADVFDRTISNQYLSCCLMKQVGDFTYSLLGEDNLDGSLAARIAASMWGRTFLYLFDQFYIFSDILFKEGPAWKEVLLQRGRPGSSMFLSFENLQ